MTRTVEGPGLPAGGLSVEVEGEGPTVLLVHGTGLGRPLWEETVEALGPDLRAVAYDRRAYGMSGAPEPYGGTTVEEQTEDAAALLRALGGVPAVLCGHELGALVCLDLMRRHSGLVRAAVLVEPPVLSLSPRGPEAMGALRQMVEHGAGEGGPAGAVEAYLAALGGPDLLALLGEERRAGAGASARAFAADLAAAPGWQFARRELRGVRAPVVVLSGARSSEIRREVAAALADLMAARLVLAEAGHFVPLEDAGTVVACVRSLASSS